MNAQSTVVIKPARLLVDQMPVRLQLVEDASRPGKLLVRGEFARAGQATENKRVYPLKLWEREINKLSHAMTERKLYGECDHPADGRTMLARVSHLVTGLHVEDGVIVGEAEVLDTARGKDLQALLRAGAKVGVSSRGYGSTATTDDGVETVQEDYQLQTFDFVAEPADSSAYPEMVSESMRTEMTDTSNPVVAAEDDENPELSAPESEDDDEALAKEWAKKLETLAVDVEEKTETRLRDEFASTLLDKIQQVQREAHESAKKELLADTTVFGAKATLDKVREALGMSVPENASAVTEQKDLEISQLRAELKAKDVEILQVKEDLEKMAGLAKEAGYRFFLEKTLKEDLDADLIRKLVGDVKKYDSAAALKTKVESLRSDLSARREAVRLEESQRKMQADKIEKERSALVEQVETARREAEKRAKMVEESLGGKVEKLSEALERSLEMNKELAARVYAEKRLANHPNAAQIRPVLEGAENLTEDYVDKVINGYRAPVRDADEMESVRARVRSRVGGGRENAGPLAEEHVESASNGRARAMVNQSRNYNGLDADITTLRKLSGI